MCQDLLKKHFHFQNLLNFIKHHSCIEIEVSKANKVTVKVEIKWKPIKGKLDVTYDQE